MRPLLAVLLVAGLGCGGGSAPAEPRQAPEPQRDELVAAVERALVLLEAMATAAEAAVGDCDSMVLALDAVASGPDADAIREVSTVHAKAYRAREAELDDRYGARMSHAAGRLGTAISPCSADPGIVEALGKVGL